MYMRNKGIEVKILLVGFFLTLSVSAIRAADAPDLTLTKFAVAPNPVASGETATLTVEVKNIGTAKSRAVTLFFHGDEKALQAFGIPMANAAEPEVPAGQVFNYTSTKKISLSPGTYTIQGIIWPGSKPQVAPPMPGGESNVNNNEAQVQFTVKPGTVSPQGGGIHTLPPEKYKLIEPKKPGPLPPDPLKSGPAGQTMPSGR
ncbi:MAG: hypothetical protein MUF69_12850 [Desulfobacterota bacterium]|nr:hypothetical protein [Thermodesulfobacteriota bacterium]